MIELKNLRSLNTKHFDIGNGEKEMEAHTDHLHYFDKLGGTGYREIDCNLSFDNGGWAFKYHSFYPFIPEYSNDWIEFRDLFEDKDQTTRYRSICENNVKGELISEYKDNPKFVNNGVIYRNSFGDNLDLLVYNNKTSMVKVGVINSPNEQIEDVKFTWEIDLPEKSIFRVEKRIDAEEMTQKETKTNTEDGKLVGYRLETDSDKNFNTDKKTLIGNSKLDGKEWFTCIREFKAWDSTGKETDIEARIYIEDGKKYLEKTIPLEFLQSATGKVFADTTTDFTTTAARNIGKLATSGSWASARDASTGSNANFAFARLLSGTYGVSRWFFNVDTSSIPDDATISAASFHAYVNAKAGTQAQSYNVYDSTATDSIVDADFNNAGTTAYATAITLANITTSAFNTWTLNSTGISNISKTAPLTKISLREVTDDVADSAPGTDENIFIAFDQSGNSNDPFLRVVYSTDAELVVDTMALDFTFNDVTLTGSHKLAVDTMALDFTFNDVILTGPENRLEVDTMALDFTFNDVNLTYVRHLTLEVDTMALDFTFNDVEFSNTYALVVDTMALAFTFNDVGLRVPGRWTNDTKNATTWDNVSKN